MFCPTKFVYASLKLFFHLRFEIISLNRSPRDDWALSSHSEVAAYINTAWEYCAIYELFSRAHSIHLYILSAHSVPKPKETGSEGEARDLFVCVAEWIVFIRTRSWEAKSKIETRVCDQSAWGWMILRPPRTDRVRFVLCTWHFVISGGESAFFHS